MSLPGVCGPLWSSFHLTPNEHAIFLPAADCLSWRSHPAINSLTSSMTQLLLQGCENAGLFSTMGPNRTAYMHYGKRPGKKPFVLLFLFVCVIASRNHLPA